MPAPRTAYPTSEEVLAALTALPNVVLADDYDAAPALASAVEEWERLTEYAPFLSSGVVSSRRFDPPGPRTSRPNRGGSRVLRLRAGLVSLSSLRTGVEEGSPGCELVRDRDFWLTPDDAPDRKRPYTSIEFAEVRWGLPRSIVVSGVWGFGAVLPDEAWKAVLDLATADCLRSLREGVGLGPVEIKDDEVSHRFSIERIGSMGEDLAARAAKTAFAYRLLS